MNIQSTCRAEPVDFFSTVFCSCVFMVYTLVVQSDRVIP